MHRGRKNETVKPVRCPRCLIVWLPDKKGCSSLNYCDDCAPKVETFKAHPGMSEIETHMHLIRAQALENAPAWMKVEEAKRRKARREQGRG